MEKVKLSRKTTVAQYRQMEVAKDREGIVRFLRIETPAQCSPEQLDAFVELVLQGRQVRATGLRERIGRAHWLAFHYEDDELAAVAALKQPSAPYRDKGFRQAKATSPAGALVAELGWVFTREKFRSQGISHRLLEQLLKKVGQDNLFATTRLDNRTMQGLLKGLGFQQVGQPFAGTNREHLLQLWVRGRWSIRLTFDIQRVREMPTCEHGRQVIFANGFSGCIREGHPEYERIVQHAFNSIQYGGPVGYIANETGEIVELNYTHQSAVRHVRPDEDDPSRLMIEFWAYSPICYLALDHPECARIQETLERAADRNEQVVWANHMSMVDVRPA